MKGFAFVLLCALVAVQGRHTGVESTRSAASLGENPWVVHLRIAVGTSGLLNTCAGSLVANTWVLTAASCVTDARFIWVRYGTVNVINPSLVTETSVVRIHPNYNPATGEYNVALININRIVVPSDNIRPVSLSRGISGSARYCGFSKDDSAPGEELNCFDVDVIEDEGLLVTSEEVVASKFDIGAPLVSDGVQIALLGGVGDENGIGNFGAIFYYADWIEQETGLDVNAEAVPEVAPEAVHFVQ